VKILQLGKFYPPDVGGIETVMLNLTTELNKNYFQCDVLCSNSENLYKEEFIDEYKVYRTKSWGKYFSTSISPQMIFKLRKIINEYDIVHIHHPDPMATLALFLAYKKSIKIVVHWHADIVKQKIILKFYSILQQWMLRKADLIVTTSPTCAKESQWLQNFQYKTISIPIGIHENTLTVNKDKLEELKKKYANKKIVFSIGRHVYYKGFEYLIKSAKYLDDEILIVIGGSGPLTDKLTKLIEDQNLNKKVELVGRIHQEDLGAYYVISKIFCLPSIARSEAFGVVQLEAMTFKKPLIATKIFGSGTSWVNKNNVSGINVNIKKPKEIAKAVKSLLSSNDYYEEISAKSFKRFDSKFRLENMVSKFMSAYKTI